MVFISGRSATTARLTDVFAIQDEVTHAIADALQGEAFPGDGAAPASTPNLRAYEVYLKALDQWSRPSPESLVRVKEFLDRAVALDPEFAPRTARWACTTRCSPASASSRHARSSPWPAPRCTRRCASSPLCLKRTRSVGVWAGGYDNYDWHEAERHWRVAMAREPVSCHVHFWYGNHYLVPLGRFEEALDAR